MKLEIANNLIFNNQADNDGGGVYSWDADTVFMNNCTIYGNEAGMDGGGIYIDGNSILLNSIFWNNIATYDDGIYAYPAEWADISFCDIQDTLWPGEGNININPRFRNPAGSDFRLQAGYCGDQYDSPGIDAGHPDSSDGILDCLYGLGSYRADLGAYGGNCGTPTAINEGESAAMPENVALYQNYPNPFNAQTMISYELFEETEISIEIYDILGRSVRKLANENQVAGLHSVIWDAKDAASGVYFYKIRVGEYSEIRKCILMK